MWEKTSFMYAMDVDHRVVQTNVALSLNTKAQEAIEWLEAIFCIQ